MQIKADLLRINTAPVDSVGGAQPEPEERPAERVFLTDIPVKGNIPIAGIGLPTLGVLERGAFRAETTVGEFAEGCIRQCRYCRWFNRKRWIKNLMAWRGTAAGEAKLNELRAGLLETQNASVQDMHRDLDGEMSPDHALASLGLCEAYGDLFKDDFIVHPLGSCPDHDESGTALPMLFKPRAETQQEADEQRDAVLNAAKGPGPLIST